MSLVIGKDHQSTKPSQHLIEEQLEDLFQLLELPNRLLSRQFNHEDDRVFSCLSY